MRTIGRRRHRSYRSDEQIRAEPGGRPTGVGFLRRYGRTQHTAPAPQIRMCPLADAKLRRPERFPGAPLGMSERPAILSQLAGRTAAMNPPGLARSSIIFRNRTACSDRWPSTDRRPCHGGLLKTIEGASGANGTAERLSRVSTFQWLPNGRECTRRDSLAISVANGSES